MNDFFMTTVSESSPPSPTAETVPVFVIIGESNALGSALNSDATTEELSERSKTYIFDNINQDNFQLLKIEEPDSNNLLGGNFDANIGVWHGLELITANRIESGDFSDKDGYIIKAAWGGSVIANWDSSGSYYLEMVSRVDAALAILDSSNINYKIYFLFSLGINDAIAATDPDTWYSDLVDLVDLIRINYGNDIAFYATQIMLNDSNYIAINSKMNLKSDNDSLFYSILTSDASQKDTNHWDYDGFKKIGNRMLDLARINFLTT